MITKASKNLRVKYIQSSVSNKKEKPIADNDTTIKSMVVMMKKIIYTVGTFFPIPQLMGDACHHNMLISYHESLAQTDL